MIKILVCLKQVAYLYSRMGIDSAGKIDPDGIIYIPNPYDELALEEALRIKHQLEMVELTLISMGPPRVEDALRYGLAMGADRAILICNEDLENIDPWVRAKVLVKVIEKHGFDLILCGKKAIDDNGGVVGGFVAELLGFPFISSVTEVLLIPEVRKARMFQVLERGDRQLVECGLPVLLSIEKGRRKPRYPTVIGRLNAARKEINKLDTEELGVSSLLSVGTKIKVPKLSILRPKPKNIFTPDSSLSVQERIKLIMSGGVTERKSSSFKGSPHELAEQFINFLEENRIMKKRRRLMSCIT